MAAAWPQHRDHTCRGGLGGEGEVVRLITALVLTGFNTVWVDYPLVEGRKQMTSCGSSVASAESFGRGVPFGRPRHAVISFRSWTKG